MHFVCHNRIFTFFGLQHSIFGLIVSHKQTCFSSISQSDTPNAIVILKLTVNISFESKGHSLIFKRILNLRSRIHLWLDAVLVFHFCLIHHGFLFNSTHFLKMLDGWHTIIIVTLVFVFYRCKHHVLINMNFNTTFNCVGGRLCRLSSLFWFNSLFFCFNISHTCVCVRVRRC